MTLENGEPNREPRLRLWPGVVAIALAWLIRLVLPVVWPEGTIFGMLGGLVFSVAVLVWWAFFSRVPRFERWGAFALMIVAAIFMQRFVLDRSIATAAMNRMYWILVIPTLSLALVVWAVAAGRLGVGARRAALVAAILLGSGGWAFLRTDGLTGDGRQQLAWRWSKTPEQKLLAGPVIEIKPPVPPPASQPVPEAPLKPAVEPTPTPAPAKLPPPKADTPKGPDWPGFRGPHRDGVVPGVRIKTDWAASPPVEMWRRPVGPGWSSFAVRDGLIYTQEQRGDYEIVACQKLATGEPVWTHRDQARFWESNGGAGPRGTPTLSGGRVYAFGATGILNVLDAHGGTVVWTHNAASDTGAKLPGWGFSSSPLVVDDLVIVAASGRLVAYDLATGNRRWNITTGGGSYSSPQLATIDGVAQILMLSGSGATSVAPADGKVLWKHAWPGSTILQPALTADGGVLITTGGDMGALGTRRLNVAHAADGWKVQEAWTSNGLKPYFNDLVVHNGHAYGFDGSILACIDVQDGKRKWKGGRYGNGQMLLLPDQDLLLVLSEEGGLALVPAVPGQFSELARFKAMDDKTWNHPVLAGDVLLVRNAQEMVAYRLALAGT